MLRGARCAHAERAGRALVAPETLVQVVKDRLRAPPGAPAGKRGRGANSLAAPGLLQRGDKYTLVHVSLSRAKTADWQENNRNVSARDLGRSDSLRLCQWDRWHRLDAGPGPASEWRSAALGKLLATQLGILSIGRSGHDSHSAAVSGRATVRPVSKSHTRSGRSCGHDRSRSGLVIRISRGSSLENPTI